MPAVELTVLNTRLQSLQLYRSDPQVYLHKLEDLLSLYSSEKTKLGENIPFKTLLPQMNVPDLVLQKITETFPALAQDYTENAIVILDALWEREELELKQLAINLLLCLPASKVDEISRRLPQWTTATDENILHQVILNQLPLFNIEITPSIRSFIEGILMTDDHELRKLAFRTLTKTIEQKNFSDLPWVFHLITPIIKEASLSTYGELNSVMAALIGKSEIETASFLCDIYTQSGSEKAKKYIRKITPLFNKDNQKYLIEVLQND
ncbi:MAG: hypothetical protein C4545_03095 [Anaerolineaceae bacterium]|jgi:hypothetical protein|nr:MAG: hypothetical protein C4545_03095 [Anaerolineaceae bacterium]